MTWRLVASTAAFIINLPAFRLCNARKRTHGVKNTNDFLDNRSLRLRKGFWGHRVGNIATKIIYIRIPVHVCIND